MAWPGGLDLLSQENLSSDINEQKPCQELVIIINNHRHFLANGSSHVKCPAVGSRGFQFSSSRSSPSSWDRRTPHGKQLYSMPRTKCQVKSGRVEQLPGRVLLPAETLQLSVVVALSGSFLDLNVSELPDLRVCWCGWAGCSKWWAEHYLGKPATRTSLCSARWLLALIWNRVPMRVLPAPPLSHMTGSPQFGPISREMSCLSRSV